MNRVLSKKAREIDRMNGTKISARKSKRAGKIKKTPKRACRLLNAGIGAGWAELPSTLFLAATILKSRLQAPRHVGD
jgi:hypothetical protein